MFDSVHWKVLDHIKWKGLQLSVVDTIQALVDLDINSFIAVLQAKSNVYSQLAIYTTGLAPNKEMHTR